MLPISESGLPSGRRQHRRQSSTPSAAQSHRVSPYPGVQQRRGAGHRRGISLDSRQVPTTFSAPRQKYAVNTTTTNHAGLAAIPQHHVLREAQQHSQQARPGPATQQATYGTTNLPHSLSDSLSDTASTTSRTSGYLVSPHGTPQSQCMSPSFLDAAGPMFGGAWSDNVHAMAQNARIPYGQGMLQTSATTGSFDLFGQQSPLSTSNFFSFPETPEYPSDGESGYSRKPARRISNGIADQVTKYEKMGGEPGQRASTPPFQTYNSYLPPTPTETPNDRAAKREARLDRFSEGYDESMEETLKPTRQKSRPRSLAIFSDNNMAAVESRSAAPSTPKSSPFANQETFAPVGLEQSDSFDPAFERPRSSVEAFSYVSQQCTPTTPLHQQSSAPFGSRPGSQRTTPHSAHTTPHSQRFTPGLQSGDDEEYQPQTPATGRRKSPHVRTESMASMQSAASISDINFEEAKQETGISQDEIARYIIGPDLADGKWTCTFEDCGKKFGRKENIKSHVQTHLNDRPYQCPSCIKRFVRQHDLKRHAKIHTGIKPYPCECGNRFARHDALTRHKQRGMCVGAFEGIVKRNVKRGRPRKPRPDMDDRMDKASRTRRKNASTSSVSSQSQTDSSAATTPVDSTDMFDDILHLSADIGEQPHRHDNSASSSAPMPSSSSGHLGSDYGASPSTASQHSFVSPHEIMENTPQMSSPASQPHTPSPELPSSAEQGMAERHLAMLVMNPSAVTLPDGMPNLTATSDDSIGTTSSLDDLIPLDYSQGLRSSISFPDMDHASMDREFKFDDLIDDGGDMFATDDRSPFFDFRT